MKIQSIKDQVFGVNSYIIIENGHSIIIDPVVTAKLKRILRNYIVDFAIVTHEHYDHICGVNAIRKQYSIKVLCGNKAEPRLKDPSKNLSKYTDLINKIIPFGNHTANSVDYRCSVDGTLFDDEKISWYGHNLVIKETPGHSIGSISILLDNKYLFSGDSIFKKYETASKMPGGKTKDFKNITEPWLDSLQQDIIVYPGHTEPFQLKNRYGSL